MPFAQSEYTFFAIVGRDDSGDPVVLGLQTNAPDLSLPDFGIAAYAWSVESVGSITVGGGSSVDFTGHVAAERDTASAFANMGFIGLTFDGGTPPDARPFVENLSTTVDIRVGTSQLETATLHFRAVPPPTLVRPPSTTGPAAVFGAARLADAHGFQLSAQAAGSWTGGVQWVAADATDPTFADDGTGTGAGPKASVTGGDTGDYILRMEGTADPQFNTAEFDPANATFTIESTTFDCGVIDTRLIEAAAPDISVDAPTSIEASSSETEIAVAIEVAAEAFAAKSDLSVELSVVRRADSEASVARLTYDAGTDAWTWDVDPSSFADPVSVVGTDLDTDLGLSPVYAPGWTDYAISEESRTTLGWSLTLTVPDVYSEATVTVEATDLVGQLTTSSATTVFTRPGEDAGPGDTDGGTTDTDGGSSRDAGSRPDAGMLDGGGSFDGGTGDSDDGGCGCRTTGSTNQRMPLWALLPLIVVARRRVQRAPVSEGAVVPWVTVLLVLVLAVAIALLQ